MGANVINRLILVTGASGALGSQLIKTLPMNLTPNWGVLGLTRRDIDLSIPGRAGKVVELHRPAVVINTAAHTAVDDCETNRDTAMRINGDAPGEMAAACEKIGARMIQISTDYVFDGTKKEPYIEDDPTGPVSVYGLSKLEGELGVRESCKNHTIIRTAWVYGLTGKNFVRTIIDAAKTKPELQVVNDQIGSPTFVPDLADAIARLVWSDYTGTLHVTNGGYCSWYEFAKTIVELKGLNTPVKPVTSDEYKRPAKRPKNSRLDNSRYNGLTGSPLPPWSGAIRRCLASPEFQ